jgi:hypothetical protein
MEVRIGVVYTTRELVLESDESAEQVASAVDKALEKSERMLWLTDNKGRRIGVPTDKIAYVEVAGDAGERKVGFGVR